MSTPSKQLEIKTTPPTREESTPRQPNERDESHDSQASPPREDMKRAYKDLEEGQVDTDSRNIPGVDDVVNDAPRQTPDKFLKKTP